MHPVYPQVDEFISFIEPTMSYDYVLQNAKGGYSGKKETRAAAVGRGKDGSFMNEVDIPTSPMLMRECEQIGVETPRDQNESLPTPCHKGNGVNVLIRTQAAEPSDVRGRRASAGVTACQLYVHYAKLGSISRASDMVFAVSKEK
ncbi:hypothetical protein Y032_0011g1548 [Ancylostoma ceylanicum]|uniref:Uncharacterized protein n=1 Tax=Ancylostoma ceylanicum TaxID=53326 RepID=A0A016VFN3_9BILA|nr:hypothetical protein Y032_0011g1548 [Ancylostoma ceylanicum]